MRPLFGMYCRQLLKLALKNINGHHDYNYIMIIHGHHDYNSVHMTNKYPYTKQAVTDVRKIENKQDIIPQDMQAKLEVDTQPLTCVEADCDSSGEDEVEFICTSQPSSNYHLEETQLAKVQPVNKPMPLQSCNKTKRSLPKFTANIKHQKKNNLASSMTT